MDETIVLIGASGGLGRYLMCALADRRVIGTYCRNNPCTTEWHDVYQERTNGEMPEFHWVDVTFESDVEKFVALFSASQKLVLVNLCGVAINAIAHRLSEDAWDRVVDVNLKGPFLTCKHFIPLMKERGWGRIINISSVVGQKGVPGTAAYAASKAGVLGLTRTLAIENAKKGITANALALGYFTVGMIQSVPEDIQQALKQEIPMGRFGHPKNVELAIRFLIDADYVTGAVLNINGGLL